MLQRFYGAVLPRTGHYCLFSLGSQQHTWASSLDSLMDHTEARIDQQGLYFGTASFKEPTSRKQVNVQALRSLRLDIDAGAKKFDKHPDGAYPTQKDALRALRDFIRHSTLAPSYIISSGEGLHVYYALDADVEPEVWVAYAKALGTACADLGLKADPTVTCDTARILRPIGTPHPNGSRVTVLKETGKVYSLADLDNALGAVEHVAITAPARTYDMSVNADVAVPTTPKTIHKIIAECGAMNEVATLRGDVPEPFWRAAIGIAKHTVEGAEAAHMLSDGYFSYDFNETQAKFDNWTTGPSTCAEFSKHTKACSTCKHNGKIKSPAVLGFMTAEAIDALPPEQQPPPPAPPPPTGDAWDGLIPAGFVVTRAPDGMLTLIHNTTVEKKDDTGATVKISVQVPITHEIFWLKHWVEPGHSDDSAQVIIQKWDEKTRMVSSYPMEQSVIPSLAELLKELARRGIQVTTHRKAGQSMSDLIKAQLQRIKMMSRRPKITERFGLRILPDGQLVCAHGRYVIYPDGSIVEGMLSKPLREKQGSFPIDCLPDNGSGEWPATVWKDYILPSAHQYAEFMRAAYGAPALRKYQLTTMLAMASPFMAFVEGAYHRGIELPPNSLTVALCSQKAGRGKTDLIKAIMLAWGSAEALSKVSDKSSTTDIARTVKLSLHGTIPISMDEAGGNSENSIATTISAVANGAARERGTKDAGMTSAAPWALINIMAANKSLRGMVNVAQAESTAIQTRLLEMNVDDIEFDPESTRQFRRNRAAVGASCAGAFGAVLHYAACRIGAERLNEVVVAGVEAASKLIGGAQDARFQYRALGALIVAHKLLKQEGLELFDLGGMVNEFKRAHDSGVTFTVENVLPTDGRELMARLLGDLKPFTLVTYAETNRCLEPTKFDIPLNNRVPDVIKARHIQSLGFTYVTSQAIRDWCTEKKISEKGILDDCKNAGVFEPHSRSAPNRYSAKFDLAKGLKDTADARNSCYKINTRRLNAMLGHASDDDAQAEPPHNVVPLAAKASPPAAPPAQPLENEA